MNGKFTEMTPVKIHPFFFSLVFGIKIKPIIEGTLAEDANIIKERKRHSSGAIRGEACKDNVYCGSRLDSWSTESSILFNG